MRQLRNTEKRMGSQRMFLGGKPMKKSEIYHLAQIAVINSQCIAPETKIEVLRELMKKEEVEIYCEKVEGKEDAETV